MPKSRVPVAITPPAVEGVALAAKTAGVVDVKAADDRLKLKPLFTPLARAESIRPVLVLRFVSAGAQLPLP
jgi:hypothetical protein